MTITDLAGKLVNSDRLAEVNRRIYQFDASDLNNGAYTVTVELDGKRFSECIVVAH
ncbi:MAG: T9SS type A sorting domain-containing protein [Flavobacteriales bacterium]|nr:T9SS type A sorting domain-containing protein [Flavobacteriales bacterium]